MSGIFLKMKKDELKTAEIVIKAIIKLEKRIGKLIPINSIDKELKSKMSKEEIRMGLTFLLNSDEIEMPRWEVFKIKK